MADNPQPRGWAARIFKREDWDGKERFRWQKRPLTPEEEEHERLEAARKKLAEEQRLAAESAKRKKEAHTKLRIVVDFIDKEMHKPEITRAGPHATHLQLVTLGRASEYLNEARKLDPTATVHRQLDDQTHEWTIDLLAANILQLEANLHVSNSQGASQAASDLFQGRMSSGNYGSAGPNEKRLEEESRAHLEKARAAYQRLADEYLPNNAAIHREYGRVLLMLEKNRSGKERLEKALALDPEDIETIKLLDSLK